MSVEFLVINPHLAPFFISFLIGAVLLAFTPLHYRLNKKSFPVFLTHKDFMSYNKFQKRLLFFGILFLILGISGAAFVSEEYGYNRVVFDIYGNKMIENSKDDPLSTRMNPDRGAKLFENLNGTTVILGTWDWDIEKDEIGKNNKADLWWSPANKSERYLIPQYGAKIAIVLERPFGEIDENYLRTLNYYENKVLDFDSDPLLKPGVVIAVITGEGNYAKVKVIGFRQLHDFTFEG